MIRTSKAPFEWPLPWGGAAKTVVYIRAGDPLERGAFEGDLAGERAGRVFDFQLAEAFDSGLAMLLADAPDDLARVREIAAAVDAGDDLPEDEKALLAAVRDAVAEHWPQMKSLVALAARRNELTPTMAFQRFVTGWEGVDLDGKPLPPFRKGFDGLIPLDLMGELPPLMIRLAGLRAYQILWATGDEKNSAPPSPSDESPRRSRSDRPKRGGSSAKTIGRKARSRPSRKAASPS